MKGEPRATKVLQRSHDPAISIITWMEVLVGAADANEEQLLRSFLGGFEIVPLTPPIADQAVKIRKQHRIKLPDAIILTTAQIAGRKLITRNTRDFGGPSHNIRVPYRT